MLTLQRKSACSVNLRNVTDNPFACSMTSLTIQSYGLLMDINMTGITARFCPGEIQILMTTPATYSIVLTGQWEDSPGMIKSAAGRIEFPSFLGVALITTNLQTGPVGRLCNSIY
jgi:hypothetical protein